MNHRERWVRTMHYQPVDHVPDEEFGYWDDTLRAWHSQGLPEFVTDNGIADRYFGFAPRGGVPVHLGLIPGFEARVLEETDKYVIHIDGSGVKSIVHKDGRSTIPKYLEFPIKTRDDWKEFKERLNPEDPRRFPTEEQWQRLKQQYEGRDYPLGINCGSLFGWIRDWMGFENVAIACAEDPDWIEEMMEHITNLVLRVIDRAVREVQLDFAAFWEDMCFNKGPIISPRMFKQWMVPRYKRITDFLKQHGVDVVYVDCDGNINELVELWLEGGVNCMFPLEVRGGSDPVQIRKRFGNSVLMMGGVDKTKLAEGPAAIRAEIRRLEPLVAEGGYIPHVDHRVPPDVSYENYLYYLKTKREAFGIPEPPPYEERAKSQG
ncbi:MAG: uroporphyrinogen decarboxylase family protein [Armatimonadota bacterium]